MSKFINIIPQNVLIFYDYPQLFIGIDQIDTRYVCLVVEELENSLKYLCCPISTNKLNSFINGKIDLLSIISKPEKEPLYYLQTKNDLEFHSPVEINLTEIPSKHLPQEGFFLSPINQEDEIIINEAYNRNKAILHLIIKETEESNVSISLLSDLLINYQKMIKYAFKNSLKNMNNKSKCFLDKSSNYQLKAFASTPGSFNIHLESSSSRDLFGNYEITSAFNIIDEIIKTDFNRDDIISKLIDNKGHFIGSLSKFLEVIVNQNVSLLYNWSIPKDRTVTKRTLSYDYAKKVYDLIKERNELSIEERILIGNVVQADVERGNWRLLNLEDNNEYKGTSSSVSLSGIVLKEQTYKFTCEEILEEANIIGKEKTTLNLIKYTEVK